jgi:PRTRC genetic system protein B
MDTNILTEELLSMLVPKVALVAYMNSGEHGDKYYLEMRTIGSDGTMGTGEPVTCEFLKEISETYSGKNNTTPSGAIPVNLLYADTRKGSEKYIWYNPPRKRVMYFTDAVKVPDGEYHVPGVIYVAGEGRLMVYAFTGKSPSPDAKLYDAPFFNTSDGGVCLGTATLKRPTTPTYSGIMTYWEDRFWLSKFSHAGGNSTKSGLVSSTKAAADKPFDTNELKPTGKTLKSLLK